MAPKRKAERKTGIDTLDGTPPNEKSKTTQATLKATGLHTLAGSNTRSKAQSSKAAQKKGLHTLSDLSVPRNSTNSGHGGRSHTADDEHDGDYVEDGASLGSDDEDLVPALSHDAHGTEGLNKIYDACEHQVDTEDLRLGTRSQSKAAVRHEEATRAMLMFLEQLSRGTDKAAGKVVEAEDSAKDRVGKELAAEV